MRGINIAIIMGNLGADPELRHTNSGTAVCDLRVAVGESVKKGDNWEDHTEWFSVTCWGKTAENAAAHLRKGSGVHIQGRNRTESWEDSDGNKKYRTKIICDRLTFLPKGTGSADGGGGGSSGSGGASKGNSNPAEDPDVPF